MVANLFKMSQLKIETIVINNSRYFTFLMVCGFGGTALFLTASVLLSSFIIFLIGFVTISLSPLIFSKYLRGLFSKNAILQFENDQFSVDLFNKKSGLLERSDIFTFGQIKSFKAADSEKDDSAFIKLYLNDGRTIYYTFLEQGKGKGDDVTDVLTYYIKAYNEPLLEEERILPLPMLFATKRAKYYLIGLTILLIGAIIVEIIYKPKSIPFSLFTGATLYLLILAQRKIDIERFKKMS